MAITEDDPAAMALSLPESMQTAYFDTRDFRARGRIFLTLPGGDHCVLHLTPLRRNS